MKQISVAVADDHALFRKGLVALLHDFPFIKNVMEASDGRELLDKLAIAEEKPEIILLDLKMPVMDGVEATEKLKELYPDIKIVILTMQDDENFIIYMIEKGVSSYLLKNVEPNELKKILMVLQEKEYFFNEKLSNIVMKALHSKGKKTVGIYYNSLFTEREQEVLNLICQEYTNSEIAEMLGVSKRTIDGHRMSLFEKSGAKNTAGLVIYAVKYGIFKI